MGVRIVDKVTISDLLTNEGKIAGATGFSILDGTFYVIQGKSSHPRHRKPELQDHGDVELRQGRRHCGSIQSGRRDEKP